MKVTNIITGTRVNLPTMKLINIYIEQEVIWMNEEEAEKPKKQRHYYTSLDFKIRK